MQMRGPMSAQWRRDTVHHASATSPILFAEYQRVCLWLRRLQVMLNDCQIGVRLMLGSLSLSNPHVTSICLFGSDRILDLEHVKGCQTSCQRYNFRQHLGIYCDDQPKLVLRRAEPHHTVIPRGTRLSFPLISLPLLKMHGQSVMVPRRWFGS